MKKEYSFSYNNNKYVILDNNAESKEVFSINVNKLQFDTLKYYEALFNDVNEQIEIEIKYAIEPQVFINNEKMEKTAKYIFDTIKSLTSEICDKLNSECFSTPSDANKWYIVITCTKDTSNIKSELQGTY